MRYGRAGGAIHIQSAVAVGHLCLDNNIVKVCSCRGSEGDGADHLFGKCRSPCHKAHWSIRLAMMLPQFATLTAGLFLVVHLGMHAADHLLLSLSARHRRTHYQQAVVVVHYSPLVLVEAVVHVFFVLYFRDTTDIAQTRDKVVKLIVVGYWGAHAKDAVSSLEEEDILGEVNAFELCLVIIDERHQQHIEWRISPNELFSVNGKQGHRILREVIDVIAFTAARKQ